MADLKGSAATLVTAISDSTRFLASDGGADRVGTGAQFEDYIGVAQRNVSAADQTIGASTTAYVTDSGLLVPTNKLRIRTVFRWRLHIAKSAASTAALTVLIKFGTAGTTADATRCTFTTGAQTAAADEGILDITATVRGPLSAAGIVEGGLVLTHELASTGLLTKQAGVYRNQSAGFDVTVANLIAGIAITTGASHSITVRQCIVEALNL